MQVVLVESAHLLAPPEAVWAELTTLEHMTDFVGFGPIPGVARAAWLEGAPYAEGSVREVTNLDGSRHLERVQRAEAPRVMEDALFGFTSPLRHVVREGFDRFELERDGASTRLRRTTSFVLSRWWWWPLVWLLLHIFFRRAVRRHHEALARRLTPAVG